MGNKRLILSYSLQALIMGAKAGTQVRNLELGTEQRWTVEEAVSWLAQPAFSYNSGPPCQEKH